MFCQLQRNEWKMILGETSPRPCSNSSGRQHCGSREAITRNFVSKKVAIVSERSIGLNGLFVIAGIRASCCFLSFSQDHYFWDTYHKYCDIM